MLACGIRAGAPLDRLLRYLFSHVLDRPSLDKSGCFLGGQMAFLHLPVHVRKKLLVFVARALGINAAKWMLRRVYRNFFLRDDVEKVVCVVVHVSAFPQLTGTAIRGIL